MFKEKYIKNSPVFYSDLLSDLNHCFTTRGVYISDITSEWGVDEGNTIKPNQTHSVNIKFANIGLNDYPDTDSIILTNKEQCLYLRFADCTPVILYDKKANVGAVTHAGWRGTVGRITPKTVKTMLEYSGSDFEDIYCAIGPAIGKCCYKVGEEVTNGVKNSVKTYDNYIKTVNNDTFIDLKGINAQQLTELGVPSQNIDICPFCTSCRNDLFYSYRKENGTDKRHYAIIKLN